MYTWGYGLNGRLGLGDETDTKVPTLVVAMLGKRVRTIASHLVALHRISALCISPSCERIQRFDKLLVVALIRPVPSFMAGFQTKSLSHA